ncbi:hypothetical protein V1318_02040 [Lysobacter sp. CCNWLW3]|uniref:hypothetical protein n=1 Tax=unclassified Lysobacter TaxID=2635362 RepID=UPI002FD3B61A
MKHSPVQHASRSRRTAKAEKPQVSRIAFLGSAQLSTEAGETVLVQSLCWPALPTAWIDLTHALHALWAGRGNPSPHVPGVDRAPSWVRSCAPQLAAPFAGTAAAEETSIATLLARTPMRAAIAVFDSRDRKSTQGMSQQALSQCLSAYDRFLQTPLQQPCTLLVSRGQTEAVDKQCLEELGRCRTLMPEAPWLRDLQLQFWNETPEPLPLELAQIVAAAAARHALAEDTGNDSIFEAILTKLTHNPIQRRRSAHKRR